jgi:hypothetical protein
MFVRAMKSIGWAVGVVALAFASAVCAQNVHLAQWSNNLPPPLHPTVIFGQNKGKSEPIVAVRGESPQIMVDGKLKSLPWGKDVHYMPMRAAGFAPGSIALRKMEANSFKTKLVLMFSTGGEVDGGTLNAGSNFSATLIPTQDYKDCFAAIVIFDQDYLEDKTDQHNAFVQFEKVPDLIGGKENKIKLHFGFINTEERRLGYFPLFFTAGREIRTDQCETTARFFRKMELTRHQMLLKGYLEKNAATPALALQPYLRVPPIFTEPAILADAPDKVGVSFLVNEEGQMENLQFESPLPNDVSVVLRRTLNGWLFLPRIKDGRPMRSVVRMPLELHAKAEAKE